MGVKPHGKGFVRYFGKMRDQKIKEQSDSALGSDSACYEYLSISAMIIVIMMTARVA